MPDQQTLPGTLPTYFGRPAVGIRTTVGGAANRLTDPHRIDDRVVLVIEARCTKAGHRASADGLIYDETFAVDDLYEVKGSEGLDLLLRMRGITRIATDDANGLTPLPFPGDAALDVTDEADEADAGVVVVIFSDGTRCAWPAEFDLGVEQPNPGELFEVDGGGRTMVLAITDTDGNTLAAWDGPSAVTDPGPGALGDGLEPLEPSEAEAQVLNLAPNPQPADYAAVDRKADEIAADLDEHPPDLAGARRLLEAERRGRGRGLKTRKGVVELLERCIARLEAEPGPEAVTVP